MIKTRSLVPMSPITFVPDPPDKSDWHRIEEREHTKTPVDRSLVGKVIHYSRVIARCGYFVEPKDMPRDECRERAYQLLVVRTGMTFDQVYSVISCIGGFEERILRPVLYEVRGDWCDHQKKDIPEELRSLRTFWYRDGEWWQHVNRIVYRWVGVRCGHYIWRDPEDWEPDYLEGWVFQGLYDIGGLYVHPLDVIKS